MNKPEEENLGEGPFIFKEVGTFDSQADFRAALSSILAEARLAEQEQERLERERHGNEIADLASVTGGMAVAWIEHGFMPADLLLRNSKGNWARLLEEIKSSDDTVGWKIIGSFAEGGGIGANPDHLTRMQERYLQRTNPGLAEELKGVRGMEYRASVFLTALFEDLSGIATRNEKRRFHAYLSEEAGGLFVSPDARLTPLFVSYVKGSKNKPIPGME